MGDVALVSGLGAATLLLREAACAAGGAVTGSVGSAIMRDAGHDGYQVLSGARNGAVGGAVLAIPVSLASYALLRPFTTRTADGKESRPWPLDVAVNVAASAAYTVTGSAILRSAGHDNVMDVYHSGRAGLVGAATMSAAVLALGVVLATVLGVTSCGLTATRTQQTHTETHTLTHTLRHIV